MTSEGAGEKRAKIMLTDWIEKMYTLRLPAIFVVTNTSITYERFWLWLFRLSWFGTVKNGMEKKTYSSFCGPIALFVVIWLFL